MVTMILEHFRQQTFISKRMLVVPHEGKDRVTGLATHIFSGDREKRDKALITKIIDISGNGTVSVTPSQTRRSFVLIVPRSHPGPCVKIYPNVMRVFERLHLVFYRSREYSERPALQEAILAKIGRRTFPTYELTRTNTVFRDRDELLKYEAAIKLHYDLLVMIDSAMGPGRSAVVYVRDGSRTIDNNGTNTSRRSNSTRFTGKPESDKGDQDEEDTEQERRRLEVIGIYERVVKEAESIRDEWRRYIAAETEICKRNPNYFLLRFSPGIYTVCPRSNL